MANLDFFRKQSKNFLKDYKSRVFNEQNNAYEYNARYFHDIESIIFDFDIDEENFTLMNSQHIIARLSGFYKWNELIKASKPALELGKCLLENRETYQRKYGLHANIVEDWIIYENQNLKDCDDHSKLEVFKKVFLEENKPSKNSSLIIDFSDNDIAQDMLVKIMKAKNTTANKAILSSIKQKNCISILSTDWADIAVSLWGHNNSQSEFEKLYNPSIEIKPNKDKTYLLNVVMEKEQLSLNETILYFMIFELQHLGYHI